MKLAFFAFALAAGASAAAAQAPAAPPAISRDEAMAMDLHALADLVLRQTGMRVTGVTHPNYAPGANMETVSALFDITFATDPHAAELVGLCAANRIDVDFAYPGYVANRSDTRVQARRIRAEMVYKVVGPIDPTSAEVGQLSWARRTEEDRRCRAAGPVIPATYSDRLRPYFFRYQGEIDPERAVLVLQRALAGRHGTISCDRVNLNCSDPSAVLRGLDLATLDYVHAFATGVGEERDRYRIEARFVVHADENRRMTMMFAVEATITACCRGADPIQSIGPGRLWLGPFNI